MSTQLSTKLETKIEALCAFTAAGSIKEFQTLNDEIQHTYLNAICNLAFEIKSDYQLIIEQINNQ